MGTGAANELSALARRWSAVSRLVVLCVALASCAPTASYSAPPHRAYPAPPDNVFSFRAPRPEFLRFPKPPSVAGCYHYGGAPPPTRADAAVPADNGSHAASGNSGSAEIQPTKLGQWTAARCATFDEMSRIPRPLIGSAAGSMGIQSQFKPVQIEPGLWFGGLTAGIIQASVTVSPSGPTPGSPWRITNTAGNGFDYSVQLNTNAFRATCHSFPPGDLLGADLEQPCTPGDSAAVQFTLMVVRYPLPPGGIPSGLSLACIWNVDVTSKRYFWPATQTICTLFGVLPLSPIEVDGLVGDDHNLYLVVTFPGFPEAYSTVAPDWNGLCWNQRGGQCNWLQASGTIYGYGNGSGAIFDPGDVVQTTVEAATCIGPWLGIGTDCASVGYPFNPFDGGAFVTSGIETQEWNNLDQQYFLGGQPVTCETSPNVSCSLTYTATSPSPP
jgi:hypothetical protein